MALCGIVLIGVILEAVFGPVTARSRVAVSTMVAMGDDVLKFK